MKKLCTLFIFFTNLSFGQETNFYGIILQDFFQSQYSKKIYAHECSGLKFSKEDSIDINLDSSLCSVNLWQLGLYFDSSLRPNNKHDEQWYNMVNQSIQTRDIKFDIRSCSNCRTIHETKPTRENKGKHNFLRLSSIFRWNNNIYIEIWMKKGYYSSGTHIIYQLDEKGKILATRQYNMCDEHG